MDRTKNSDLKKNEYIQQGDVLACLCDIPKDAIRMEGGVLQHGKVTGHAHRFDPKDVEIYIHEKSKEKFLRVLRPSLLTHEEHKEIMFPKGDYKIGIVTEYDPFNKMKRQVVD